MADRAWVCDRRGTPAACDRGTPYLDDLGHRTSGGVEAAVADRKRRISYVAGDKPKNRSAVDCRRWRVVYLVRAVVGNADATEWRDAMYVCKCATCHGEAESDGYAEADEYSPHCGSSLRWCCPAVHRELRRDAIIGFGPASLARLPKPKAGERK